MRTRIVALLLTAIVLMSIVTLACGPEASPESSVAGAEPSEAASPPEKPTPQGGCGDGVCDQAEQDNPALCPQDCAAAAPPTQPLPPTSKPPTPTVLPATPTLEAPREQPPGKCGDGVCDDMEKQNPQLCPQDCTAGEGAEGAGVPGLPATGIPAYEPPINIFLVLHIDPSMEQGGATFKPEARMYERSRDEIDWLMAEAERHNLHFTALYNGWFTQWALQEGDMTQFRALVDSGHEIGSHAHRLTYDPGQDLWVSHVDATDRYGRPNYDVEITRQCWNDATRFMDQVVAELGTAGQNQTMCAVPFKASDEGQLMRSFGFTLASGNRSEKGTSYFGHQVWNPWRPATSDEPGYELDEDLDAEYISLDHLAQIGRAETHGMDLTVPQLQRRFLMLYAEWLARERTGSEDRVWTFGFCLHPNYGDQYNAQLTEFLTWLDEHFVGQESPYGNTIARYATIAQIGEEYTAWEAAHPGTSSFHYVRDDPYPYSYALVPTLLADAAYEADVDLGSGVSCFRFTKDGRPLYMLWSDVGERTVDLSRELSGQVQISDMAGEEIMVQAAAILVTESPLFVEPVQ